MGAIFKLTAFILICGSVAQAAAPGCRIYNRYTWILDLKTQKVSQVDKSIKLTEQCQIPISGNENVLVLVKQGGKPIYQRNIFVNLETFFDSKDLKAEGGHVPATRSVVISYLPTDLPKGRASIVFQRVGTTQILAQGSL